MTPIAEQVSRAIRILRGNRDESARASHLVVNKDQFVNNELLQIDQAEKEKCSQSTFSERKIMKTAFKRVALVAAAALAIGGVTAVSAQAAAGITTPTAATQTLGAVKLTTAPVIGSVAAVWTQSVTFTITSSGLAAGQTVAISEANSNSGTSTATNVVASAGVYTLAAADVTSATSATFTTNIVYTAASNSSANYIAAAGTQILTPTVATFAGAASGAVTISETQLAFKTGDGAAGTNFATGNGVAGAANTVTLTATSNAGRALVTISGAGATISTPTPLAGSVSVVTGAAASTDIVIATPTAGTITANLYNETANNSGIYSTTASSTVTITVNATAQNNVYSAAKSTVYGNSVVGTPTSTTDAAFSVTADKSAGNVAQFEVTQNDANGTALSSGWKSVSAYATIGTFTSTTNLGGATGPYVAGTPTAAVTDFVLGTTGVAGTSTVTITVNGVAKTYSVTFSSSSIAKITKAIAALPKK